MSDCRKKVPAWRSTVYKQIASAFSVTMTIEALNVAPPAHQIESPLPGLLPRH
jgi:hypothetical protein